VPHLTGSTYDCVTITQRSPRSPRQRKHAMTLEQQESSSREEGSEMPNRIDVLVERIANLQEDVKAIGERLEKWDDKNSELVKFENKVLGAVAATNFYMRVFGCLLAFAFTWVGAVNFGLHSAETRLTTLETAFNFQEKATTARNSAIDDRLNGFDRHNANVDADVEKLKIDSVTHSRK
jgi:uncharacterized coiled-coil protein SlyX